MSTECYPIATLPHTTRLFRDFLAMGASAAASPLRQWYGAEPLGSAWMFSPRPNAARTNAAALADALERQSLAFGAGAATLANISKLRDGARAIVTGQQVGLLGGPLLTLLKAASAVARAKQATVVTAHAAPVGNIPFDASIDALLDRASELLHHAPICELLRECYASHSANNGAPTFAGAFARLMTRLFASHGLIVMDAAGRDFHALGASTLRFAVEHAEELEAALLARTAELEAAGYHAQVLVKPGASLLFLVNEVEGAQNRQALHRMPDGSWKAGTGNSATSYATAELLAILDAAPERLSPNALLRPVFQDTILPTTAYIGGPAEVAYFAQSAVLYQRILGHITPILPRLSATLVEPAIGAIMAAARALPIEAKRRLADAGNALDHALAAAHDYLGALDPSLARSAEVSASKMRYQMGRLRRLAATFELHREASLRKHAEAISLHLFPNAHPQERVLAGVWFLAAWESAHGEGLGTGLIARLVEEASSQQPDHLVIRL